MGDPLIHNVLAAVFSVRYGFLSFLILLFPNMIIIFAINSLNENKEASFYDQFC